MTTSESKGRFFLLNESIRIDSQNELNRIDSNRELECSTRHVVTPHGPTYTIQLRRPTFVGSCWPTRLPDSRRGNRMKEKSG